MVEKRLRTTGSKRLVGTDFLRLLPLVGKNCRFKFLLSYLVLLACFWGRSADFDYVCELTCDTIKMSLIKLALVVILVK